MGEELRQRRVLISRLQKATGAATLEVLAAEAFPLLSWRTQADPESTEVGGEPRLWGLPSVRSLKSERREGASVVLAECKYAINLK